MKRRRTTRQTQRPIDLARRVPISIRIAPETLERFRATGPGWQVRMNDVLDREAARLAGSQQ